MVVGFAVRVHVGAGDGGGGSEVTVTVAVQVVDPPRPSTVAVYVTVDGGVTVFEPDATGVTEPIP